MRWGEGAGGDGEGRAATRDGSGGGPSPGTKSVRGGDDVGSSLPPSHHVLAASSATATSAAVIIGFRQAAHEYRGAEFWIEHDSSLWLVVTTVTRKKHTITLLWYNKSRPTYLLARRQPEPAGV